MLNSSINISELIDALRAAAVQPVPFDQQWFDLDQLAAYLHYEKSHVSARVVGLPGFPAAVKCGTGRRWRARDVCRWLENQQPVGRPRKTG